MLFRSRKNYSVIVVAVRGEASPKLKKLVDKIYWLSLNEFSRMFDIFKQEGVNEVIMAGQISPHRLFTKEVRQDRYLGEILAGIRDKKADSIFGAIANKLKEHGLKLIDSTIFIKEHLPQKGVLTKGEVSLIDWQDVDFGFQIAKGIAALDIGQTVAVKDKAIVAVEALEGTDHLIRRAGKVTKGGFTLVKVSKPNQDMRFDIPVVGLNTVKNLAKAKARCLAIEAEKTIFIDRQESIALANRRHLAIVAV